MKPSKENNLNTQAVLAMRDSGYYSQRTIGAKINSGVLKKMSTEEAIATGNEAAKKIVEEQDRTKDVISDDHQVKPRIYARGIIIIYTIFKCNVICNMERVSCLGINCTR